MQADLVRMGRVDHLGLTLLQVCPTYVPSIRNTCECGPAPNHTQTYLYHEDFPLQCLVVYHIPIAKVDNTKQCQHPP